MRIGLIRHFEVVRGMPGPGLMTAAALQTWLADYDASDIRAKPVDLGGLAWDRCLSSDSPRALRTATAIYDGPIVATPLLREPNLRPLRTGGLRLPYWGWRSILRLAWMTSHPSQREAKREFLANVAAAMDMLLDGGAGRSLVVSHAGIMMFLRRELLRRGFRGPRFKLAEHATLYVFERPGAA
jgi:broad specificity phosphatase PhoE